jgi:hypothetical protein
VLRHRFPAEEPDQRRRTAARFATGRTPVEAPLPPSIAVNAVSPLPLSGMRARATAPFPAIAPAQLGQLGCKRARARARARVGRNPPPPPAQLTGNSFFFFFSHFFSPFSYIYLYADILCTKNSLNKFYGTKIMRYKKWHTPP